MQVVVAGALEQPQMLIVMPDVAKLKVDYVQGGIIAAESEAQLIQGRWPVYSQMVPESVMETNFTDNCAPADQCYYIYYRFKDTIYDVGKIIPWQ